jgi:alpha-glucosidase
VLERLERGAVHGVRHAQIVGVDDQPALSLRALAARRASPALSLGGFELLPAPDGVIAWRRFRSGDARTVLVNFLDEPRDAPAPDGLRVQLASDGVGEGAPYTGRLGPAQAVILR